MPSAPSGGAQIRPLLHVTLLSLMLATLSLPLPLLPADALATSDGVLGDVIEDPEGAVEDELTDAVCLAPHPPIDIEGDVGERGLVRLEGPAFVPRPGSGVTGGSGTAADPYRIDDLCIRDPIGDGAAAIRITGTTRHVLLRNITFGHDVARSIEITGSADVRLEYVAPDALIWVTASERVELARVQNAFLRVSASQDVRVADSSFDVNSFTGAAMQVRDGSSVSVERSRFFGAPVGLSSSTATRLVIANSSFEAHGQGVVVSSCGHVEIRASTFATELPIHVRDCASTWILDNEIHGGTHGIRLSTVAARVERNIIDDQVDGILLLNGGENIIRDNVILRSSTGVAFVSSMGNILLGNAMLGGAPLRFSGSEAAHWLQEISVDNTHDGAPVRYHRDVRDLAVNGGPAPVYVVRSENVSLRGEQGAIVVAHSQGVHILNGSPSSVRFERVRNGSVRWSEFVDGEILLSASNDTLVEGNRFEGGLRCILVYGSPRTRIASNAFDGCGIQLGAQAQSANISQNTFVGAGQGIAIEMLQGGLGNGGTTVSGNVITGHLVGVVGTAGTTVTGNDIWGNALYGVTTSGSTGAYDATGNWWGCGGGPGAVGCDGVGEWVMFAPARTARVPGAGAP